MPRGPLEIKILEQNSRTIWKTLTTNGPFILSVIALVVSVFGAYETVRHDRVAAEPHISFGRQLGFATDDKGMPSPMGLTLDNSGSGTGIITGFSIYLDGRQVTPNDETTWDRIVNAVPNVFHKDRCPSSLTIFDNQGIQPNSRWTVFTAYPGDVDVTLFRKLIRNRLVVRIHVCSSYKDCSDVCSTSNEKCDGLSSEHVELKLAGTCAARDAFL